MPKDKDQAARLREINRLLTLRKGAYVSTEELMRACDVQVRQLRNDIQALRNLGAQIKTDYKNGGYQYEEPFDLVTMPMSTDDVYRLKFAAATLAQFGHLDIFQDFTETVQKIEQSVERWLRTQPEAEAIFFDTIPHYHGTVFIPLFLRAIRETRVVKFAYQSFKSPEVRYHEFQPWFLREHKHRWFVFGWLPAFENITPFALDRVCNTPELTNLRFSKPVEFDPKAHFAHTIGMTVHANAPVEEIVLQFSPEQTPYFLSKPFHPFEAIDQTDETGLRVKMRLILNFELVRKLAEIGPGVRVLAPKSLVSQVRDYLASALAQYK